MLVVEPATAAVRFSAGNFESTSRRLPHSASFLVSRNKFRKLAKSSFGRRGNGVKNGIRASGKEQSSSGSGPLKQNAKPQRYHPSEDIAEPDLLDNEEARLTPAETTRTVIEVNSKATLMFTGLVNDESHENIFLPDLPYVTDEYGSIYFQLKNGKDILQTLMATESLVQVIIGLDTAEMISEIESLGQLDFDFAIDDIHDDDSVFDDEDDDSEDDDDDEDGDSEEDDDYEKDWVDILDEDDEREDSDGSLGDWAKLETMRTSHPLYFAKKLAEVVSDDPIDFMDQPPAGLAIQGLLRPAFLEEHSIIQKQKIEDESNEANENQSANIEDGKREGTSQINGHSHKSPLSKETPSWTEELDEEENLENETTFYKLEMIKIQLISAHGHQTFVEVEDFRRSQPDAIAHSAPKIIGRIKSGGEKTIQAFKSLCWRCKGIQAEDAALIGVDSLGFDMRVCAGTQVQTLRFAFKKRASSEYSAERQLNDLLFPRIQKLQHRKEARHTES